LYGKQPKEALHRAMRANRAGGAFQQTKVKYPICFHSFINIKHDYYNIKVPNHSSYYLLGLSPGKIRYNYDQRLLYSIIFL
jgi:hypothetical protein